jgi:hypothetical protein
MINVAEPEPHQFGGAGSGAATRCGSDSDGSKLYVKHGWIIKNVINSNSFLLFLFTFQIITIQKKQIFVILKINCSCGNLVIPINQNSAKFFFNPKEKNVPSTKDVFYILCWVAEQHLFCGSGFGFASGMVKRRASDSYSFPLAYTVQCFCSSGSGKRNHFVKRK